MMNERSWLVVTMGKLVCKAEEKILSVSDTTAGQSDRKWHFMFEQLERLLQ